MGWKDLGGDEGEETMIRIYSMKKNSVKNIGQDFLLESLAIV